MSAAQTAPGRIMRVPGLVKNRLPRNNPLNWLSRATRVITALLMVVVLAACDANLDATPIVMFPTAQPPGVIATFNPGGGGLPPLPTNSNPLVPTTAFRPTTPLIVPTTAPTNPPPTIAWNALRTGVEWAVARYQAGTVLPTSIMITRFDPRQVTFRVHYLPGQGLSIRQWQQNLPTALAIVNANFFTAQPPNMAIGLVVADSVRYGAPLTRTDAALFQVSNGVPRIRWTALEPLVANERFEQVAQAYPILVGTDPNRGPIAAPLDPSLATLSAPRTVIAQDRSGRILFIVTQNSATTLGDLTRFLLISGMDIAWAVNMDGGQSSGLYLATSPTPTLMQGANGMPVVVAVYPAR